MSPSASTSVLESFYLGLREATRRARRSAPCSTTHAPYPDYPTRWSGSGPIPGRQARPGPDPTRRDGGVDGRGRHQPPPADHAGQPLQPRDGAAGRADRPGRRQGARRRDEASTAADAATDVAFSPDGKLVYVTVPTRDGNDTLFRVGEVGDVAIRWRPASTICGVKLVTLATTAPTHEHVYAVGLRGHRDDQRQDVIE